MHVGRWILGHVKHKSMYKYLKINQKDIFDIFRSMGMVRQALEPETDPVVEINFQTARDALDALYAVEDVGEERTERLSSTRLELIFHGIVLANLPDSVPTEIRDSIPVMLIQE
jgi:hypothetical protein